MNVVAPARGAVPLDDAKSLEGYFSEGKFLELLVAIRGSAMPDTEKIRLRDLVLEYSQQTEADKQTQLQADIISGLSQHPRDFGVPKNATQSSVKEQTPPEVAAPRASGLGRMRLRPSFGVPATGARASEPSPQPESTAPATQTTQASPPAEKTEAGTGSPLARIQEIKQSVNSRIGNPVNLIDADNAIGREYMNALLDAMKKASGGEQSGALLAAMNRLEAAYQSVESLLEKKNIETPPPAPAPQPATPPTPEPEVKSESVGPTPEVVPTASVTPPTAAMPSVAEKLQIKTTPQTVANEKSDNTPKPTLAETATKPGLYHQPEESSKERQAVAGGGALRSLTSRLMSTHKTSTTETTVKPTTAKSVTPTAPSSVDEVKKSPAPEPIVKAAVPPAPAPEKPKPQPSQSPQTPSSTAPVKVAPVTTKAVPGNKLPSVGEVETLPEKMSTLKKVMDKRAAAEAVGPGDDVMAPQVTAGLEQLLSEWKLFKRSGLLGTGPNGIEHPLYKQLAVMPMAAVISGRFEGATPEIKQSITDYMNGWRYEQGVVHQMNEQFEHYLRRVILSILKRQKEEAGA